MAFKGKANRFAIAALSVVRKVQASRAQAESGGFRRNQKGGGNYDCEFPGAMRELREHCAALEPATQRKIMGENAARCYGLS
jgi:hypothetical protein